MRLRLYEKEMTLMYKPSSTTLRLHYFYNAFTCMFNNFE